MTGACGGLGFAAALGLAQAGRRVLLTGRDPAQGAAALARLRDACPGAAAEFGLLDMASLGGIAAFAERITEPVGLLVNNAAVMALPRREVTQDGIERQFGVNYLGHFALVGRLLDRLRHGRVVNLASLAHRRARLDRDDPGQGRAYDPWAAYATSKLAMLMFALELERRSRAAGWGVTAIAAHPGWSRSRIVRNGPGEKRASLKGWAMQAVFDLVAQPVAAGVAPVLFAALDPGAAGGAYYGPCCLGETRGRTAPARIMPQAADIAARAWLWALSERLSGVRFPDLR